MNPTRTILICSVTCMSIFLIKFAQAQTPDAQFIPQPAIQTDAPYQPQALLPGGIVVPLYPPDSSFLNKSRIHEAEVYKVQSGVPGRVVNITNVHNPSMEVHTVEKGSNTGAAVILIPGGSNKSLVIAMGGTDFVPYFFRYGVTTIIFRARLRADGYDSRIDPVNDTLQAIRLARAHAEEWGIDPLKIGVMGFSAGAEHASGAGLLYKKFDAENNAASDPLSTVSSRPDFICLLWPGPSLLSENPDFEVPSDIAPAFIASASYGGATSTGWGLDYYSAMLKRGVPNIEAHLYGRGRHGGGLADRDGIPFGTWQDRFIDWFRDLGFLGKPGIPTKAAADTQSHVAKQSSRDSRK